MRRLVADQAAKFAGCAFKAFPKSRREIGRAVVTQLGADVGHGHLCFGQQLPGSPQPLLAQPAKDGQGDFFAKGFVEPLLAGAELARQGFGLAQGAEQGDAELLAFIEIVQQARNFGRVLRRVLELLGHALVVDALEDRKSVV